MPSASRPSLTQLTMRAIQTSARTRIAGNLGNSQAVPSVEVMPMSRRTGSLALFLVTLAGTVRARAQTLNLQEGFAPVVDRVMPSVVNILIEDGRGRDVEAGSGFIVSPEGLVVTNLPGVQCAMRRP